MVTAQDITTYVVTAVMNLFVLTVHHLSMVLSQKTAGIAFFGIVPISSHNFITASTIVLSLPPLNDK